jgi:hypothetical protein
MARITTRRSLAVRLTALARPLIAAVVVGALLIVPAMASASRTVAPPGNSSVSQYVETVPTAKGNRPTSTIAPGGGGGGGSSSGGSASSGSGGSSVSAKTAKALSKAGKAGQRALALARATAPGAVAPAAKGNSGGSSALSTLVRAATGSSSSGGMGSLLPAILIVVALCGAALAFRNRRTTT